MRADSRVVKLGVPRVLGVLILLAIAVFVALLGTCLAGSSTTAYATRVLLATAGSTALQLQQPGTASTVQLGVITINILGTNERREQEEVSRCVCRHKLLNQWDRVPPAAQPQHCSLLLHTPHPQNSTDIGIKGKGNYWAEFLLVSRMHNSNLRLLAIVDRPDAVAAHPAVASALAEARIELHSMDQYGGNESRSAALIAAAPDYYQRFVSTRACAGALHLCQEAAPAALSCPSSTAPSCLTSTA